MLFHALDVFETFDGDGNGGVCVLYEFDYDGNDVYSVAFYVYVVEICDLHLK